VGGCARGGGGRGIGGVSEGEEGKGPTLSNI